MKVIRDDLWLCDDCLFYAVNGDTSGIDDPNRERDVIEGVNALGPHLVPDFDSAEDADEDNGIREFSYRPCDACGTRLGGGRHRFAVLGEEKPRKRRGPTPSNMRIGSRKNPISDSNFLLALGGVAVVGTIGYLIWKSQQNAALAAQATAAAQAAPQTVASYLATPPTTGTVST
jgi:hypothetical protein